MIPQFPKSTTVRRSCSDFNEQASLLFYEITEIGNAYFDLIELPQNECSDKAETYLLNTLSRLCCELSFFLDKPSVTESVELDEDD